MTVKTAEAEITDLRFLTALLMSKGNASFEIHAMGCADVKRTVTKGHVQNQFNFKAANEHDAIYEVYCDQIDESFGEGENYQYHTQEEAIEGYASDVHFNDCCRLQWGGTVIKDKPKSATRSSTRQTAAQRKQAQNSAIAKAKGTGKTKPAPAPVPTANGTKSATAKREVKRQLATLVVQAAAAIARDPGAHGIDLADLTAEEAGKFIAHWLHHLPADRERWVASGLPKPDRSDWR